MDKYNMYDVLDVGSIWRSKRHGHLHVVLALANFSLPEKYLKTNPPQVIFSDGNQVLATTADRFLSLRNYVRQDDSIKNAFFNMAAMPITEEEREPSLQLDNEEDAVEENELIVDEEQTSTRTLTASAEEKPQIIKVKVKVNTDADDVKEKLNAINADFINYRQLRTVDSIYYHTISVSSIDYVQTIVNNIYEIESIEILINGRIKIDIANPQITTAYTEVCNNKPVYSITFADASQATEAYEEVQPDAANDQQQQQQQTENEPQYTTNALSSILSAVAEDIYRSGSSSETNDAAEITANNSSIESAQKDDSQLELDFEQGIVIAEPAEKLTEELVNNALADKPEEDNSLETEAKLDAEVENTAEIDEADGSKVEAGSEVNEVISTEGISLSNEHESSEVVIEDAATILDEGSVATEEVEDEELSSNEETDVDELDEVTVDSNIAIVDDDVDSNSVEETDYALDHTLATDDSEEFSLDDTQPGQAVVVEQSADDKLVEKLENIVK